MLWAWQAQAGVDVQPTLKLFAEERYDDDMLLRGEVGAGPAGGGQLMTKLSPQAGVEVRDHTLTLKTWYAADFVVRHGSGNSSLDHRGALDVKKVLTERLTVDADVRVWRVSDPTSLPRLGMARTLSPILYGRGEASGAYRITERWTGRVGYRFEGARIFDGSAEGGVMHSPYAEAMYRLTRRADVGARYRLQYFGFGAESADANALTGEFRYRLSPVTNFTARAGAAYFRSHEGSARGVSPVLNLQLEQVHEQLELGLVAGHDLVGASGFASALWADYASFIGSYRFQPRLRAFWAASIYRNGAPPAVGVFGDGRSASGYALGGGLEWRITKMVSVQGTFDRLSQFGGPVDAEGAQLSRNIVAGRLTIQAL
jgi:opacity protein-like surface antigen